MAPRIDLADDPTSLADALAGVNQDVVGLDVERADSHRYYRTPALIQVGVPGRCVLVDSVAIPDCVALDRFLAERTTILHALENDLVPLEAVGVNPADVHDTAIAAALLGLPTGLTPLLAEVLEVELDHDKQRYQRADWERRPLTDGMAAYAADDVVHLPALWEALAERLDGAGRRAWYDEELAATVRTATDDVRDWTRTRGMGRLSAAGRALLQQVWEEREMIAREDDIAPQRLLHDDDLVRIAQSPPRTEGQLLKIAGRRRKHVQPYVDRFMEAVERGETATPIDRDPDRHRWDDADRDAFDAMRRARSRVAKEVGIDAGVLCPSRQLKSAVGEQPADADALCVAARLRSWQLPLLRDVLWDAYTSAQDAD